MSFITRFWISALMLFIFLPGAWACSLPAEPSAAVVPINSSGPGVELVEVGNSFYYLVPQGFNTEFKLVWDPVAHNSGSLKSDKYDWCTKENIPFEPNTDKPNGYGYFPITKMKEFFQVKGNRGSVVEAFKKATGLSTDDAFIPGNSGIFMVLVGFAKPGQESELTTLGGGEAQYFPDTGLYPTGDCDYEEVSLLIDDKFASPVAHEKKPNGEDKKFIISWDQNEKTELYKLPDSDKAIHISSCGLLIDDLNIEVTEIDEDDYKAYVQNGNDAGKIHIESSPSLPSLPTSNGIDGQAIFSSPDFNITFTTPTLTRNIENSKMKLMVWAPGAGFELTNIYWVWTEDVYKKVSEERVTQPEVRDASGTITQNEITEENEYFKYLRTNYCSQELKLKVIKPAADPGSTDFIVYDTEGPISSEFKIVESPGGPELDEKAFEDSGETTFNFELKVLDTNPYFDQEFSTTIADKEFVQNRNNIDLKILYSYPAYQYNPESNIEIDDLKISDNGYGLIDKSNKKNPPRFKSYRYTSKWVWNEAEVAVSSVENEKKSSDLGRIAGSLNTISGTFKIKQPKPWHKCNKSDSTFGKSAPTPVFKVLAVAKDSSGLSCQLYSDIESTPLKEPGLETAQPDYVAEDVKNNADLASDTAITTNSVGEFLPVGARASLFADPGVQTKSWSNMLFLTSEDKIAPEIQVIVFDTRTNKYHLFGNRKYVDAEFCNFSDKDDYDYSDVTVPYLDSADEIDSGHQFTDYGNLADLYTFYMDDGEDPLSTISNTSKSNTAYVCQKNSRLVFYIRAFDNINTFVGGGHRFGISSLKYEIKDANSTSSTGEIDYLTKMMEPIEHVFRFANVAQDGSINSNGEYSLKVTAIDHNDNTRELEMKILVMGRKLDIRTLEERRKRIE